MEFQLKYYKDPGLIIDAINVLSFKLNHKSFYITHETDEMKYLYWLRNRYPTPPRELLLFFYKKQENSCNFMTLYTETLLLSDFAKFSMSMLKKHFEDIADIQNRLLSHYLGANYTPDMDLEFALRSHPTLSDTIKFYLLGFQSNPAAYISLLFRWLTKYTKQIERDYLSKHEDFTPDSASLQSLISYCYPQNIETVASQPLLYSTCSAVRDYLYINFVDAPYLLITGYRLKDVVTSLQLKSTAFNLPNICAALGDSMRMSIVNYLHTHKDVSKSDLSHVFSLPASSLNHHLDKLKNAGLLVLQKQRSYNIYSLSYPVFEELSNTFQSFSKEGGMYLEDLESAPDSYHPEP